MFIFQDGIQRLPIIFIVKPSKKEFDIPLEGWCKEGFPTPAVIDSIKELFHTLAETKCDLVIISLDSILEQPFTNAKSFVSAVHTISACSNNPVPKLLVYSREYTDVAIIRDLVDSGFDAIDMHAQTKTDLDKFEVCNKVMRGERYLDPISAELLAPTSTAKRKQRKLARIIADGTIAYAVSPRTPSTIKDTYTPEIKRTLNLEIKSVEQVTDLFPLLAVPTTKIDIIFIDAETLSSCKGTTMFDLINTVATMIIATGRQGRTKIIVSVGLETPIELIKEILKIKDVASLAGRGGDFTLKECVNQLEQILQGKFLFLIGLNLNSNQRKLLETKLH